MSKVLEKLPNLDPKLKNEIMSGLQRMLQEGRQEGIQEGIRKGIEDGIQAIRDLFAKGFLTEEQAKKAEEAIKAKKV